MSPVRDVKYVKDLVEQAKRNHKTGRERNWSITLPKLVRTEASAGWARPTLYAQHQTGVSFRMRAPVCGKYGTLQNDYDG